MIQFLARAPQAREELARGLRLDPDVLAHAHRAVRPSSPYVRAQRVGEASWRLHRQAQAKHFSRN
jgi:hypothetical protein